MGDALKCPELHRLELAALLVDPVAFKTRHEDAASHAPGNPSRKPSISPAPEGNSRLRVVHRLAGLLDIDPRVRWERQAELVPPLQPLISEHPTQSGNQRTKRRIVNTGGLARPEQLSQGLSAERLSSIDCQITEQHPPLLAWEHVLQAAPVEFDDQASAELDSRSVPSQPFNNVPPTSGLDNRPR